MDKNLHFSRLPTYFLDADKAFPFKIFVNIKGKTVLWKEALIVLKEKDIYKLSLFGMPYVYINVEEYSKYLVYVEQNLHDIVVKPEISLEFKLSVIDKIIIDIIEDVFRYPSYNRCVTRLENIVKPLVELLLRKESVDTFRFMVEAGEIVSSSVPHSARICYYTVALAGTVYKFSMKRLFQFSIAALFHDIGQMLVPIEVREKFGTYDKNDRLEMQRHPVYSVEFIRRTERYRLNTEMLTAIKSHHELGDRTGYPRHLPLFDLPLEAGILAVIHTYDSFTMEKIHRKARKPFEVIEYMMGNSKKYPVSVVRQFVQLLGKLEVNRV